MKIIFQVALLLAFREAVGFSPIVSHCHGRLGTNTLLPPLHSTPEKEKDIGVENLNDSDPPTKGRRHNLKQIFDINGDRKVNHRDVGAIAALAFLSWTLLSAPVMAGDSSSASSRPSRSSSSTRSSRTSSSATLSSTRPSSSISSSASRGKASSYRSTAKSSTTSSSKSKTVSTSSTASSTSHSSTPKAKRVSMSSPKSSTARLSTKPRVATKTVTSNSNTKTAVSTGERVTIQTPKSSSARLRALKQTSPTASTSAVSSPTKTKSETPSPKLETNVSSTPSISPQKKVTPSSSAASASGLTPNLTKADKRNSVASPKVKPKDSSSPVAKETTVSLQKDAPKPKPIDHPSSGRSGSVTSKKDNLKKPPTKASVSTESSTDKNTPRKRSGKRVGGRAAKPNNTREPTPSNSRQTIIRNTYIITDPPPTRTYQGYGYFPPRNPGTAYYYNDYAPPLRGQQAYSPYRRPMCANSEINGQQAQQVPPAVCKFGLPVENEPIDVLVDPVKGLYVQGTVTLVDQKTSDFTVTYLSADGYAIQKTFHVAPQNVF